MGSPLGPVLAGILIIGLERPIIPTLGRSLFKWKIFLCVKIGTVNYILKELNDFHQNELEKNHK